MPGLRSLRNRLAVVFGLIVLGAIGTVYLSVTPRLEESLRAQKLDALQEEAGRAAPGLARVTGTDRDQEVLAKAVTDAASRSSAEVVLLTPVKGEPPGVQLGEDSTPNGGVGFEDVNALALQSLETRRPATTTEPTVVGRQALAAQPLIRERQLVGVAVFADALADVEANV